MTWILVSYIVFTDNTVKFISLNPSVFNTKQKCLDRIKSIEKDNSVGFTFKCILDK